MLKRLKKLKKIKQTFINYLAVPSNLKYVRDGMDVNAAHIEALYERIALLEKHLNIAYYNGNKAKPHYRKMRWDRLK